MSSHRLEVKGNVLLLFLFLILKCAETYECINIPPPPVNGRLGAPSGTVTARLVCPRGRDLPVNVWKGGLLECNPKETPYSLMDVPRHQCLPLKRPDSLKIHLEFNYIGKSCSLEDKMAFQHALKAKLPDINPFSRNHGLTTKWGQLTAVCGVNNKPKRKALTYRVNAKVTLKISPYNADRVYTLFLRFIDEMKSKFFNTTHGRTAQEEWGMDDYRIEYLIFSDLYSSCGKQPRTVDTSVDDYKIVSCRGCPRDYVLSDTSHTCHLCMGGLYTEGPFATTCIPCPPKAHWKESDALFNKYCVRFQADYD